MLGAHTQEFWQKSLGNLMSFSCPPVTKTVNFHAMEAVCKVKYADLDALNMDAALQVHKIAGWISAAQLLHCFFISLTLCGSMARLILYTRSVTVISGALDINLDHTWSYFLLSSMEPQG